MANKFSISELEKLKKQGNIRDFEEVKKVVNEKGKSKYGNKKTVVDNIEFDSQKEAARYVTLRYLLRAGEITDLELQKEFKLSVCSYYADFVYTKNGETIVEDVKGFKTATYRMKKKLMKAELGIEIKEV